MTAARERLALVVVSLAAVARAAWAEPSAADVAFKKGRELLKDSRYAEACVQFERSQQLDPALGTLFNIAQCDEHIGKLASALAAYREVVTRDTKPERRTAASDLATKLAPRVPKLVVVVPASAKHVTITVDTTHVIQPNAPVELDNGMHAVVVRADGMTEFSTTAQIADEGKTVTVTAKLVRAVEPVVAANTPHAPEREMVEPHSHRKTFGVVATAAGTAAIITGGVYGVLASSKWKDAKAVCGGTTCATQADADRASQLGDQARSKATLSTVLFAAGGVVATVGLVLWATAPTEHAVTVSARPSSDGGALVFSGRF